MQINSIPHFSFRITNTRPESSWTVREGVDLCFRVLWVCCGEDWEEAEEEDWTAQIEAATAHCLLRAEAGREEAWERREPVGVVRIAAVMEGDKLARRKAVTRFVRRRGGGGGRGRGGEGLDIVGSRGGG